MRRGLFVTGTDTGVGKTAVSAALLQRYRSEFPLRYWKPVQTGIEVDDDTQTAQELGQCDNREILNRGVRLKRPVSPHLAAMLAGEKIEVDKLVGSLAGEEEQTRWIVEGAGGVLVPLSASTFMVDLIRALAFPVLIVVRSSLGTINHTLLTVEALRQRSLEMAGVVMVGEPDRHNREAIEHYGQVEVFGVMPRFAPLTAEAIRNWATHHFDLPGRLKRFLE
jgi:dethiobiotin synthase